MQIFGPQISNSHWPLIQQIYENSVKLPIEYFAEQGEILKYGLLHVWFSW